MMDVFFLKFSIPLEGNGLKSNSCKTVLFGFHCVKVKSQISESLRVTMFSTRLDMHCFPID